MTVYYFVFFAVHAVELVHVQRHAVLRLGGRAAPRFGQVNISRRRRRDGLQTNGEPFGGRAVCGGATDRQR